MSQSTTVCDISPHLQLKMELRAQPLWTLWPTGMNWMHSLNPTAALIWLWSYRLGTFWYDISLVLQTALCIHIAQTPNVLKACRLGAINMHPSLLPRWRGAAPIPRSILSGDTETGVSVIRVDPANWDSGDILWQQTIPIGSEETEAG